MLLSLQRALQKHKVIQVQKVFIFSGFLLMYIIICFSLLANRLLTERKAEYKLYYFTLKSEPVSSFLLIYL